MPESLDILILGGAGQVGTQLSHFIDHRQPHVATGSATALSPHRDGLELLVWRGASRAEQGLSFGREAALARKFATDKGMRIGLDGVQLLGGHGFVKEHPVERWYRDLRAVGVIGVDDLGVGDV